MPSWRHDQFKAQEQFYLTLTCLLEQLWKWRRAVLL